MIRAAIVYDFDGTLARGNIQEHSFIPAVGMDPSTFWGLSNGAAKEHDADQILTYMMEMLVQAKRAGIEVTEETLAQHGAEVPFFDGVECWFNRINGFAAEEGLALEHFVISSGVREMIRGCSIADEFRQIFASSFIFDEDGQAVWPALSINYTTKTQYLFRINKGIDDCWDNQAINRWVPPRERKIPFQHMIFIGDGETDIPSMKMVRYQGGHAVAVFDPDKWDHLQERIGALIAHDRANFVAPADYSEGSQLDVTIRGLLGRIASRTRPVVQCLDG